MDCTIALLFWNHALITPSKGSKILLCTYHKEESGDLSTGIPICWNSNRKSSKWVWTLSKMPDETWSETDSRPIARAVASKLQDCESSEQIALMIQSLEELHNKHPFVLSHYVIDHQTHSPSRQRGRNVVCNSLFPGWVGRGPDRIRPNVHSL